MHKCECRDLNGNVECVLLPNGVLVEIRTCEVCGIRSSREIFPGETGYDAARSGAMEVFLEEHPTRVFRRIYDVQDQAQQCVGVLARIKRIGQSQLFSLENGAVVLGPTSA